jgi:hypothetical protein
MPARQEELRRDFRGFDLGFVDSVGADVNAADGLTALRADCGRGGHGQNSRSWVRRRRHSFSTVSRVTVLDLTDQLRVANSTRDLLDLAERLVDPQPQGGRRSRKDAEPG